MSCEKLITDLTARQDQLPEKTHERVEVGYYIQFLSNTCKDGRPRLTHASAIINAAEDAEMNRVWNENQRKATEYLQSIEHHI